ncbi:MAG: hypothetical protein ACI9G1_000779 [Pirellulaceae bacterium]
MDVATTPAIFCIPTELLQAETNLVAVEVHQGSGDSSGLSFDLSINGTDSVSEVVTSEIVVRPLNDVAVAEDVTYTVLLDQELSIAFDAVLVSHSTGGTWTMDRTRRHAVDIAFQSREICNELKCGIHSRVCDSAFVAVAW